LTGKSNSSTTGGTFVETVHVSAPAPLPPVLTQALFGAAVRIPARLSDQTAQWSTAGEKSRYVSAPPFLSGFHFADWYSISLYHL